jgi:hypothetical protein
LSHQRGKIPTKQNKQKRTKYPKFKCCSVSVSQHEAVVQSLSHQREIKGKKKRVWRQFCECPSEAVAHLPAIVSQLFLEALLIADLRSELNTHLVPQALFI